MSVPREELHRLVDELPDETVPTVLADLRTRVSGGSGRPWPPRWFGGAKASRPDLSEHIDEILRDDLGRRGA